MKNFEKYIDKISSLLCLGEVLDNGYCNDCKYHCANIFKGCDTEKIKQWLLEEYKEPCPLSHDEYVILKNLPSDFKWIVRSDKQVEVSRNKPEKTEEYWTASTGFGYYNHLFQFIKWEDEEPYEIAKLIEDYEKEHEDDIR